jgi:hypothetical protein
LREHDRRLVGLRARCREEDLRELPRREPRERLRELDDGSVGYSEETCDSRDICAVIAALTRSSAVADGDRQDPAEKVQVLVSVRVPDAQALAVGEDERLLVVLDRRGQQEALVLLASLASEIRRRPLVFHGAHDRLGLKTIST